jgi:hypothetical protein
MTEPTKVPERKLRHRQARGGELVVTERTRNTEGIHINHLTSRTSLNRPWPFTAMDVTPVKWWRTLPANAFRDAEQILLRTTLERVAVLRGDADIAASLAGDAAAAIDVAFSLMPITEITLTTDIAMTALCRCAFTPNSSAALVMAQIIGLTVLDHGLSLPLAASWSAYGRRYASDRLKFREAEAVLLSAFREHQRNGDSA